MCTAKLYGHSTDNALSICTRTNTKCWEVWQLTDCRYQDLQYYWLIPDRFLKRISYTICTTTARTYQQDCHYCSLFQLSLAYLLTPWRRVLLEKLASLQLVKKFPAFYGTRRFLTALMHPPPVPILRQPKPVLIL